MDADTCIENKGSGDLLGSIEKESALTNGSGFPLDDWKLSYQSWMKLSGTVVVSFLVPENNVPAELAQ